MGGLCVGAVGWGRGLWGGWGGLGWGGKLSERGGAGAVAHLLLRYEPRHQHVAVAAEARGSVRCIRDAGIVTRAGGVRSAGGVSGVRDAGVGFGVGMGVGGGTGA